MLEQDTYRLFQLIKIKNVKAYCFWCDRYICFINYFPNRRDFMLNRRASYSLVLFCLSDLWIIKCKTIRDQAKLKIFFIFCKVHKRLVFLMKLKYCITSFKSIEIQVYNLKFCFAPQSWTQRVGHSCLTNTSPR